MTKVEQATSPTSIRVFGTNGIRGVVGKEVNVDLAYRVGSSVATLFKGHPILLGRDGRVSGRMILEAVASGILAQGNDVQDYDMITTPALQYLVRISNGEPGLSLQQVITRLSTTGSKSLTRTESRFLGRRKQLLRIWSRKITGRCPVNLAVESSKTGSVST